MELWQGIKDTASFAWRAGRLNFIVGFSLMMVEPLAMPIAAVGLRGIVDNAIAGEARTAVIWAVVVAVLATLALTAGHFAHIFYFKTAEDMSALIERDIAEISNGSVGLEHHERADYADRIAYIRREADRAAWGTVSTLYGGVAIVVALAVTGALLATLSPWLLLLPVAAIPPLILGRKAEVVAKAGRAAGAPATRQANHLFGLLADAGPVKEVRTCGLEDEVRRRQQTAWDEATRLELRAEYKAAWIRAGGQIFFAVAYVGATLLVLRDAVRGPRDRGRRADGDHARRAGQQPGHGRGDDAAGTAADVLDVHRDPLGAGRGGGAAGCGPRRRGASVADVRDRTPRRHLHLSGHGHPRARAR